MALVVGVLVGALAPKLAGVSDKAAGGPFAYRPPDGFVPADADRERVIFGQLPGAQAVWLYPAPGYPPNVSVTHTTNRAPTETSEVDALARGMPEVFSPLGVKWTEVRHELRERKDRARIALLEGDCTKESLRYRTLQMAFPDDTGTSIVTASFPSEEAGRWDPAFEATIEVSGGVARLAGATPAWQYFVWGGGAAVVAFALLRVRARADRGA